MQRAIDALVAIAGEQVVGAEVGGEGEPVARERAQGRRDEGQRPHQVRGDAQQGAPLAHVLAQLVEAQALQAADAAVQRLGVVERRPAADVAGSIKATRRPRSVASHAMAAP